MHEFDGLICEFLQMPAFFFEHAATVLVVQGMVLQDFFPPDVHFEKSGFILARGPFLFLRGKLSSLMDPPLRLEGLVLARVHSFPESMSRDALLARLLRRIS